MKKKEFTSLTHIIPYFAFHDHVCLLADGTIFSGIALSGLDSLSLSLSGLSAKKGQFKTIFEHLPKGYTIQFFYDHHTDNKQNITEIENKLVSKNPICKEFRSFYLDKLKNDSGLRNINLYLFLIKKSSSQSKLDHFFDLTGTFKKIIQFLKNPFRKILQESKVMNSFYQNSEELLENTYQVIQSLKNILGIDAGLISENELSTLIYKILNPSKDFYQNNTEKFQNKISSTNYAYDFMTMREKLAHSPIEEHSEKLCIDDKFAKVLTLKVPSRFTQEIDSEIILNSLDFPFYWSFNFTILNTAQKNAELETKQRRKHAFSVNTDNPNVSSAVSKTETEQALLDQKTLGFSWYEFSLSFLISADTEEELKKRSLKLISIFRDFQESVLIEEKYAQLNYFLAGLPGCAHLNERKFLFSSLNVSDLVPISIPPVGTASLTCYFHTFRNTLFRFSTFSDEFNNYNQVVIGKTGSGKSFIVSSILNLSLMSMDKQRVMILDLGGSFKKITKIWGGEYMTIDLDEPDCGLNPLPPHSNIKNGEKMILGLLDFTVQLILLMMGIEATERLYARVLRKSILATYDDIQGRNPILQDLHKILREFEKTSTDAEDAKLATHLAKLMEDYIGDGPYANLFNRESTLNFNTDFFCFDFKNASQNEHIREIATYVVGGYITRKMTESREKKFIIFDEFATTMKHETGKTLCEMIAKNCRKHGASFICISQELNDFLNNPASQTVYQQSNFRWFLKLDDNLSQFKDHLNLNETDIDIISNLGTQKGFFSEVFLRYGDKKALISLKPDPLNYWACTTDSTDILLFEIYQKYFNEKPLIEILKILAAKYPYGVTDHDLSGDEIYQNHFLNKKQITEVT